MMGNFQQLLGSDPLRTIAVMALYFLLYLVFELLLVGGVIYLIYFLLTLPMRRNERARFFLDLLELGLKEGHSPEASIMRASSSRDPAPGARFHLLAAYLEEGVRLTEALDRLPGLLHPRITAMLRVGDG